MTASHGPSALDSALAAFERDAAEHVTAGPADRQELQRTEERLGVHLPADFRSFLERIGGGLFYQRHEIFGSHRVIIHDIELVPDLVAFRRGIERREAGLPNGFLPFHRAGNVVHLLDLSSPGQSPPVRSLDGSKEYPDLGSFLETLVPSERKRAARY
jgi:SMI1-KNR4 cell-wall